MTREMRRSASLEKLDCYVSRFVGVYVQRPHQCFCSCLLVLFVIGALSISGGMMNIKDVDGAWEVHEAQATQNYRSFEDAEKQVENSDSSGLNLPRKLEGDSYRLVLFYKVGAEAPGTIFTPQRIKEICEIEKVLAQSVTQFDSILAPFYGTLTSYNFSCDLLTDKDVLAVVNTMKQSVEKVGPHSQYAKFVQPSFNSTSLNSITRSVFQLEEVSAVDPLLDKLGMEYGFLKSAYEGEDDRFLPSGTLRVRLFFPESGDIDKMLPGDFGLAMGSVVFVFLVMWFHLKSCFLASCAMFQIMISMPIAGLFYRGIFQIDNFMFLHILVIYLVLGIGADDVFVFVDTFRHISKSTPRGSYSMMQHLHIVLRDTYVRSASAIFNTSFTTTVAFLSSSISKVMPMRTLGWFAATCIVLNYILTITFIPAALVIYHLRLQGKRCCCPNPSKRFDDEVAEVQSQDSEKKDFFEIFLTRFYIPAMQKKIGGIRPGSLFLVLAMLGTAIQGTYFASRLTPPSKAEEWVPDNHMVGNITPFWSESFLSPDYDRNAVITLFWGIKEFDISGMNVYRPDEFSGKTVWDESFDLSTVEAQQFLLETCKKLRALRCDLEGCRHTGYGTLMIQVADASHSCFLEEFQNYTGNALPTGQNFTDSIKVFRTRGSKFPTPVVPKDFRRDIGFIDGQLRYVAIRIRSTLSKDEPFGSGIAVRDLLQSFVDEQNSAAPASLKSLKFKAESQFANYDLSDELLKGFITGCGIALPVAFLVLLLSTWNVVVATYAATSVAAIVVCVLGFCKSAFDWDLGIGEAIAGVVVIGYSVDYVVHLAHIYCEAKHHGCSTRDDRATFAIKNMGSTVFYGAVTTAGSGTVMFFCFLKFFFKMAVLISATITFSFLFSLGFFMGLLWLGGPEGSFGELPIWSGCLKTTVEQKDVEKVVVPDSAIPEVKRSLSHNSF
eukprot:TRINITY_DN79072_c0_g1_i1.p1 TRINITY_DN79072_c0_g1~~TRINITY_DN79072_c0_g1_i1.p1  ORF type:complete len:946 (-),score=131.26 TRINITY_DN79072_c0_g1_i1:532-3369(-)